MIGFWFIRIIRTCSITEYITYFVTNQVELPVFLVRLTRITIQGMLTQTHHTQQFRRLCNGKVSRSIYFCLTFLTFLCSNQNDTISTTATIDGGRRSILQYGNIFNIGRIQRSQGVLCDLKVTRNTRRSKFTGRSLRDIINYI